MRLVRVRIENFRGYREPVDIRIDQLTSLIGRNDVGKSTIMEALAVFFDCEAVKIEASDVNVHATHAPCAVTCFFVDYPTQLVIDAQAPTTLADEFLLNSSGELAITKRWEFGTRSKCNVSVRAMHPTANGTSDLLQLKNTELKKRAADLNLDLKQGGVDQRSNVQMRAAIRAHVRNLMLEEVDVPLQADDGKKVWEEIHKHLPTFALFRADRPSRDDDPEVADPMRFAVQQAIRSVSQKLNEIRDEVQAQALDVAQRTLEMLREMDPGLANQLTPNFKAEPKYDGFKMSLTGDNDIPVNKRGSGIRRLILLNFFRAEAERVRRESGNQNVIYAIEEPEASLHPDKQVMLMRALQKLSEADGTQVLLTTHSPGLAGELPIESIRFVRPDETGHPRVLEGEEILDEVAETLGVTPDPRRPLKVLVYVEGPNDVQFLRRMSALVRQHDETSICLSSDERVGFVITGGDTLRYWIQGRFLRGSGCAEVHIYDRDGETPPKHQRWVDEVNTRGGGSWATLTSKRTMENYLHPAAIQEALGVSISFTDTCDVPKLVGEALGRKPRSVKAELNDAAAARMTLDRLRESDPANEVCSWLSRIGHLVEA